jgi:hypothetical protein
MAHDYDMLRQIVQKGALSNLGMPQFDELTDQQVHDLYMAVKYYSRRAARGDTSPEEGGRLF